MDGARAKSPGTPHGKITVKDLAIMEIPTFLPSKELLASVVDTVVPSPPANPISWESRCDLYEPPGLWPLCGWLRYAVEFEIGSFHAAYPGALVSFEGAVSLVHALAAKPEGYGNPLLNPLPGHILFGHGDNHRFPSTKNSTNILYDFLCSGGRKGGHKCSTRE